MSRTMRFRYRVWGWFSFLPDGPYYFVGDLIAGLDGWRPLHVRYPEHFGSKP